MLANQVRNILDILKVTARSGERNDLPSDVDDHQIKITAEKLFTDKDEIFQLAEGRWLSLRTRATDENYVLALVSDITSVKESELSFKSFAEQMKGLAETDALTGWPIVDLSMKACCESLKQQQSQVDHVNDPD